MKKILITLIFILAIFSCEKLDELKTCEIPCSSSADVISDTAYLTWEDIFKDSIKTLVGKTIIVKSKVRWDTDFGWIDDGVKPEIAPAGSIKLVFENADSFISNPSFQGKNNGDLFLISNKIEKFVCYNQKKENYALNCEELSNGGSYYLIQGKINYRDWLNVTEANLSNPKFITQSNNVVYWSQTFEFESEKIRIMQ